MPEEVNRVLTDRLSDLLLTPSPDAAANLAAEGLGAVPTVFVGNVMIDSLHLMLAALKAKPDELSDIPDGRFVLVTMHRPSNVDSVEHLTLLLQTLSDLAERMPVLFPMHPRTRARATEAGLERELRALRVVEPLGYRAMVAAMDRACLVLTDSGGIQEETTVLGVPCVTLRESTERPITVERGTNTLATWPMTLSTLRADIERSLAIGRRGIGECSPDGWDGQAAGRIVSALL
jgi:UDP-N-acetylglucosamine 2-epimerase (non-hydrolysing)